MPDLTDLKTTPELAELFGVSARTVRDLAARGVIPRAGRGRYELGAAVRGYTAHLREMAAARGAGDALPELTAERLREARERADKIALQNAAARREMVRAADVERVWTAVLRDVRSRMLAVPARVRARLGHLTPTDAATIDREVREALAEAANA